MTPLERFKYLLEMAAADNRMNEAELGFLSVRAAALGISTEEFHDALQSAVSGEAKLAIPNGIVNRRALLKDLIMMMAADGEMQSRERELFANIAANMDISTEELHQVIDATIAENS